MQNSNIDNYGAMRNGMRYNRLLRIMLAQQNVSAIFFFTFLCFCTNYKLYDYLIRSRMFELKMYHCVVNSYKLL